MWHTIGTWVQSSITVNVVALLGGVLSCVVGLLGGVLSWYGNKRLERYKASLTAENERFKMEMTADMMQQLELLKGEVHVTAEKALYMHKMQLDAERDIYKELWPKLRAVREALQRVAFYKAPSELTPHDWQERRSQFDTTVRALAQIAEDQRPFFAARIARDLFDLLELANQGLEVTEAERSREIQSSGPQRRSVSPKVTRNLDAIEHAADRLCESIRERLTGTENTIK